MTIQEPGIWERVLVWLAGWLADLAARVANAALAETWQRLNPGRDLDEWLEQEPDLLTDPARRDELLAETGMRSQVLIDQNLDRAGIFIDEDGDGLFTRENPAQVR